MADEISSPSAIARLMRCPSLDASRVAIRDVGLSLRDECTRVSTIPRPFKGPVPFDPRPMWKVAWEQIRQALRMHDRPGVLALALAPDGELVGHAWVASSWKHPRSIIIGRHSCCDLVLPGSFDELSLRHLAVLTRGVNKDEASITVLDLRSGLGFSDESGRLMHAVRAEGPVFLRVGSLVLALLVTEQGSSWPEDADDAYDTLPARVFFDEQAVRFAAGVCLSGSCSRENSTSVTSLKGLVPTTGSLVKRGETAVGILELASERAMQRLSLGATALKQGVLIGRYERCDGHRVFEDADRVSRVHALLIDLGEGPLLVDTGSSNGIEVDGQPVREVLLRPGLEVSLAKAVWLSMVEVN
ncbi:MAG: FHA domain-containing protein [Pseudomonadota bacterium]